LTAEVSKTVENAYRDVNIAFANEVALMCESLRINVNDVREFVNTLPNDPSNPAANPVRNMHMPGGGVGGHCLPKDSWLLKFGIDNYGSFPVESKVIINSRKLNDSMPAHMVDLLEEGLKAHGKDIAGSLVTILGVAFLENSDDPRNTPTTPAMEELRRKGAEVRLHEPLVQDHEYPEPMIRDIYEAIKGADALLLMTKHKDYIEMDLGKVLEIMNLPVLIDGRNAYDGSEMVSRGFTYKGVGKGQFRQMP